MASDKETMEGSEKEGEVKDATRAEDRGEAEAEKGGEVKENEKDDQDEEILEAEKEGNEGDEEGEEEEEGKDEEEKGEKEEKDEEEADEVKDEKKAKKSIKKGSRGKKVELQSPRTPGSERPTRERKTVERFMVTDTPRVSSAKPVAIEKGQGTPLKDIPNVAFKLSKRKADENLQLLHTILFGKKAKVHSLKKNIGLFSGFVWTENEEKQKAKVKEKLDKCVKEKLLDFCDVLNISVNKATTRKEELSTKLLKFLESPHETTDILLADKENAKKRKSKGSARKSPSSRKSTKKQKMDSESGKKGKHVTTEDDDGKSESSESEDNQDDEVPAAESDEEENESEEETNEDQDEDKKQKVVETGSSKQSAVKETGGKSKSVDPKTSKASDKSARKSSGSKKETAEAESKNKTKASLTKKRKGEKDMSPPSKAASPSKKRSGKSSKKVLEKDQDGGESSEEAAKEPSREEMHAVVVNMLKEVDFNTATLSDILRQLGKHFGVDLIHRKAEVKDIITEVIQNMSDEEDDEAESGNEDDADD